MFLASVYVICLDPADTKMNGVAVSRWKSGANRFVVNLPQLTHEDLKTSPAGREIVRLKSGPERLIEGPLVQGARFYIKIFGRGMLQGYLAGLLALRMPLVPLQLCQE